MKKVVLITGGTSGLGMEITKKLAADYEVVAISNKENEITKVCSEFGCKAIFCDITDSTSVQKTVDEVFKLFGHIDVLINNAGVYACGELEANGYDEIARVILVNVVGTMNVTKAVLPFMKKAKSGQIINIGSIDGVISKPERSVYSASKWAITGFTDNLRLDVEKYGINVCGIYPGLMSTGLFDSAGAKRDLSQAMEPAKVAEIVDFALKNENIVFEKLIFRKTAGPTQAVVEPSNL